jgi:hypothetical protein
MLRALLWSVALAALVAAGLFVPLGESSLWQRLEQRGTFRAAQLKLGRASAWARSLVHPAPQEARKRPPPRARVQRKPAERLSRDDRQALDQLVAGSR